MMVTSRFGESHRARYNQNSRSGEQQAGVAELADARDLKGSVRHLQTSQKTE